MDDPTERPLACRKLEWYLWTGCINKCKVGVACKVRQNCSATALIGQGVKPETRDAFHHQTPSLSGARSFIDTDLASTMNTANAPASSSTAPMDLWSDILKSADRSNRGRPSYARKNIVVLCPFPFCISRSHAEAFQQPSEVMAGGISSISS